MLLPHIYTHANKKKKLVCCCRKKKLQNGKPGSTFLQNHNQTKPWSIYFFVTKKYIRLSKRLCFSRHCNEACWNSTTHPEILRNLPKHWNVLGDTQSIQWWHLPMQFQILCHFPCVYGKIHYAWSLYHPSATT